MADNRDFSHLPLPIKYIGKPKFHGRGRSDDRTKSNIARRVEHGRYIKNRSTEISRFWKERQIERSYNNLPEIKSGIPILLEIDPETDIGFLRGLGFEIVCEIEEGYILVASEDVDLSIFNKKIDGFIDNINTKCNSPARVYALCEDEDRCKNVLSDDLYLKWNSVLDDEVYTIDIGVSCTGGIELPDRPDRKENENDEHYAAREKLWNEKCLEAYRKWDEFKQEREDSIIDFIAEYNGIIISLIDDESTLTALPDSFTVRVTISGKCMKDLLLNYAYIFEMREVEKITMEGSKDRDDTIDDNLTIYSPSDTDPIVCVIDSGIQEQHGYIAQAITSESISLLPENASTSDEVYGGGHGTRVAGAVLYPDYIPKEGEYQLPCWIRNMRVLDENNNMPNEIIPSDEIKKAVQWYSIEGCPPTKVFNHSIGGHKSCELKHMSYWAAEIDNQSYNNDILFIQAAGNISRDVISAYWQAGFPYPKYLDKELCRISDPAQSLQALTVGSISATDFESDDSIALGKRNEVSSFSRSGPGIWNVIKPEVVEYGGTHMFVKNSMPPELSTPSEVCPELIRKSPEGPAFSQDAIGTSFATPKVTYIASQIEKIFPESPALLYRALIAQSARWPRMDYTLSDEECVNTLKHIGYGIPNLERATHNNEYRITLITPSAMELGADEAHVYQVPIPEEISNIGENCNILVEITLSYTARPRRTRRGIKRYLSTWLDWRCSRMGEEANVFAERIFTTGKAIDDDGNFRWFIGDATNRGKALDFSVTNGTLQKDWCIIQSNQLRDAFCIAVRGHKGWGSAFKAKYSLALSFEAIDQDLFIYEPIRNEIETVVENNEIVVEMEEKV